MYIYFGKIMTRKTRQEAETTREMILQAALDCFYEKGFSRTSFDGIAKKINLTKGAVHWHFKNKEDLLVAVIQRIIEAKKQKMCYEIKNPKTLDELKDFFINEAAYIENNEKIKKFIFFTLFQVEWSDKIFNQVAAKIGDLRSYHLKTVRQALTYIQKSGEIAKSHNINSTALLIVSFWKGLLNTYISKELKVNLSKDLNEGLNIIINSIKLKKG
jgi:TetR/AcrR family acrAB operon transcriptional repressor